MVKSELYEICIQPEIPGLVIRLKKLRKFLIYVRNEISTAYCIEIVHLQEVFVKCNGRTLLSRNNFKS